MLIKKHRVDLVIPGIESDVYAWAENIGRLNGLGVRAVVNNVDLVCLCKDKWAFYDYFKRKKKDYLIESSLSKDYNELVERFGIPFMLKPRVGYGSKGVVKIHSKLDFDKYRSDVGFTLMAQQFVGSDDQEYTTSAFCDGRGGFNAIMSLKRKLSKDGYTDRAEVVEIDEINRVVSVICQELRPSGPTNFQFRMHDGIYKLLEINPRISSSTSIRSAFGYNESKMCVEFFLENKAVVQPVIKKGKAVRYVEDSIIFDAV